jgi:hypothetical protein
MIVSYSIFFQVNICKNNENADDYLNYIIEIKLFNNNFTKYKLVRNGQNDITGTIDYPGIQVVSCVYD